MSNFEIHLRPKPYRGVVHIVYVYSHVCVSVCVRVSACLAFGFSSYTVFHHGDSKYLDLISINSHSPPLQIPQSLSCYRSVSQYQRTMPWDHSSPSQRVFPCLSWVFGEFFPQLWTNADFPAEESPDHFGGRGVLCLRGNFLSFNHGFVGCCFVLRQDLPM